MDASAIIALVALVCTILAGGVGVAWTVARAIASGTSETRAHVHDVAQRIHERLDDQSHNSAVRHRETIARIAQVETDVSDLHTRVTVIERRDGDAAP